MNAAELYDEIKEALRYLGLKYKDMHLVEVNVRDGEIEFSYSGWSVTVQVPPK